MNELVSIIMPSFESGKVIGESIVSVLEQSYKGWELIIVDDSSRDNSCQVIQKFLADDRIKLIELEVNIGAAEARNVAIEKAQGRFIAFLDSDDLWYPKKLEKQLSFMLKNDVAFSFTAYDLINESGEKNDKIITAPEKITYNQYLRNTIIGCLTVVIDSYKVKPFKMPNLRSSHDMALWLDLMKINDISAYGFNECLSTYRIMNSSNTSNKIRAAKDVWKVYREHLKLSFYRSSTSFIGYAMNAIKKRV